ncbi:MAG: SUMF1/EgtB/PvdO family nonheme iron enzyme, partial [Caldilinea sp.]
AARILIASRPHAYQTANADRLPGFGVAQLVPLDRDRQKLLADTLLRQLPGEGSTAELMAAIDAAQVNDDMRENPLFLTLWVGLWRESRPRKLPATKAGLYRAAVDLLLSRWTRPKNPDPAVIKAIGVEPLKLRPVLEALACKTLTQQGEDFALKELLGLLDEAKGNPAGGFPRRMAIDEVDDYLERHAGILVAPRKRHYRFIHRSFQEHLAACELIHLTSPPNHPLEIPSDNLFPRGLLAKLQQDSSNWRNVARLAISELIAASRFADLRGLLEAMSEPYAEDGCSWPAVALLALEMVNDPELPELPERCAHVLRSAALRALHDVTAFPVPNERAAAGNALSRLGDPRPGVGINERDLPDIVWMSVPAGAFSMGSNDNDYDDEKPIHPVYLDAFEIAKYPVTNIQYACFVAAAHRKPPKHWGGATPPDGL